MTFLYDTRSLACITEIFSTKVYSQAFEVLIFLLVWPLWGEGAGKYRSTHFSEALKFYPAGGLQ